MSYLDINNHEKNSFGFQNKHNVIRIRMFVDLPNLPILKTQYRNEITIWASLFANPSKYSTN